MKQPARTLHTAIQQRRINAVPSTRMMIIVPWASVILASLITSVLPIMHWAPVLPPLAYMVLVAWRMLRPGFWPAWAGTPLGLIDDLTSGQPLGSAVLLFSLTLIVMDIIDERLLWRSFNLDWAIASAFLLVYLPLAAIIAQKGIALIPLASVIPQLVLSILAYPLVTRAVAALDRFRMRR
jgi:rod shape-determining protein MreD